MAGFKELLAVEWDDNAVQTFRLNFPDVPVYHGDIAKLTGAECMKLAGIKKGELDILDGSPPCQGFSTAGKRKWDDPRNSLFKEYARLLNDLQPKVFVMENVTGMIKGCMKQAYLQIIATLRGCGYKAKGRVMNAMYFNVPQNRERVIIIGVREDLGIEPSHPKPSNKPMTVRQALKGVDVGDYPVIKGKWAEIGKRLPQGETGEYFAGKGHGFGIQRLHWDKPSPTIRKTMASLGWACLMHPDEPRVISINEAKRLCSFPDKFIFEGKTFDMWQRIGNSVPPNLMKAIAEHIKDNILGKTAELA